MVLRTTGMGRKKIVFVTTSDLSGESGHNVATTEMVAAFGRNESINVTVVCPNPTEEIPDKITENVDDFYHIAEQSDGSILTHLRTQVTMIPVLRRAIKNEDPNVVVARKSSTLIVPPLLTKAYGKPYFLLIRGLSHEHLRFSRLLKRIFWVNVRLADHLYVAYEEVKNRTEGIRKRSQPEARYFTNAVDPDKFPLIPSHEARSLINANLEENDFVIGYVGSMKDRHAIEEVILAVERLEKNIKLMLVGDGPKRERLEELSHQRGVEDRVIFTGYVEHHHVAKYIAACDVMYGAMYPEYVANPIKCYEYLASGRPIITDRKKEFEFVEEINAGILIDNVSPETIVDAVRKVKSNSTGELLEMGVRGREYVLENHTWDRLPEMVLEDLAE